MKFNLKVPKIKAVRPIKLLRFLPVFMLLLLLVIFSLTITFLYQYFYQTIAQVKIVSILRNQVALNQVNVSLYNKVLNSWETKKQFEESRLEGIRDSFKPLPTAPLVNIEETQTIEEVNAVE